MELCGEFNHIEGKETEIPFPSSNIELSRAKYQFESALAVNAGNCIAQEKNLDEEICTHSKMRCIDETLVYLEWVIFQNLTM